MDELIAYIDSGSYKIFPYSENTNIIEVEISNSLQLLTMFSVQKIIDFNNSIITL